MSPVAEEALGAATGCIRGDIVCEFERFNLVPHNLAPSEAAVRAESAKRRRGQLIVLVHGGLLSSPFSEEYSRPHDDLEPLDSRYEAADRSLPYLIRYERVPARSTWVKLIRMNFHVARDKVESG